MGLETYIDKWVRADASGGGDGSEGSPWTLSEAATAATTVGGNTIVNLQDDGEYTAPSPLGLIIQGTGGWVTNRKFKWHGFHLTLGDMNPGGEYYQSAFDLYVTGVTKPNSKVIIHATGGSPIFSLSSPAENVHFQAIRFNMGFASTEDAITYGTAGNTEGGSVSNCVCFEGRSLVNSDDTSGVLMSDCFLRGGCSVRQAFGETVGCIIETNQICYLYGGSFHHNIFVPSNTAGIRVSSGAIPLAIPIYNNLFVGPVSAIHTSSDPGPYEYNNIFLSPTVSSTVLTNAFGPGGGLANTNYSLAYVIGGETYIADRPWYDLRNDFDVMGPNSIRNVDPLLIIEGGKYVGLKMASPCWFAGQPLLVGDLDTEDPNRANKQGHIGPFTYPGARGRLSIPQYTNHGRMVV